MKSAQIFYFAFKNTNSEKILTMLQEENYLIVDSSERGIAKFVDYIKESKPQYVVGLGEYSGRDKDKIRIETVCNKNFRNKKIGGIETLDIYPFLLPLNKSKLTKGMGNSWCNLVSVKVLNSNIEGLRYTFLHIPRSMDEETAKVEIQEMLVMGGFVLVH